MTAVKTLWGPAAVGNIATTTSALSSVALNDSDNAAAWTFNIPYDGSITDVGIFVSAENGTSPAYNVGLVTLDANGRPTTTAYGGSAVTSAQWTDTGWKWVTLSTAATANAGDWAAVYIYPGGTPPDGSNNISVLTDSILRGIGTGMYYTTAWTGATSGAGVMAIKYGTGVVHGIALSSNTAHIQIRSNTTPDEAGCKFTLPAAMTCYGAKTMLPTTFGGSATIDIVLYDASDNVLASATVGDKDYIDDQGHLLVHWDGVALAAATTYRLIIKPTTATSGDVYVQKWSFESTAALAALPNGDTFSWTERTDAGTWTDTTTATCPLGLLVSDITFSTTSGGGGEYAYIG